MVNYTWTGATDTSSINVTNWSPNGLPGPNDVVIFDSNGTRDCSWQHPATSPSITVDEMIIESDFAHDLQLNAIPVIKGMSLNKNIIDGTIGQIEFRSGPIASGGYKTYNSKYLLIGDSATYSNGRQNLTFDFYATNTCAFDDGQYPNIRLALGDFTPKYTTPTGTSGVADFYTLSITSGVSSFAPDVSIVANDKNKHFKMASGTTSQFVCSIAVVNWGTSTVEFTGVSSGTFNLPVSLTTDYNSGTFEAYYRKMILSANSTGDRIDMQDNRYLSVEEFEIGDGLLFVGPRTTNAQGSDVRTILPPKIRGSWSFSSISDGIYRSPRQASGPMPKIAGNFHITGKLNVDGLIDPTGLELTPQSSNPGGVAANTLWLNSTDSNKLYQGSSAVGGGGGGAVSSVFGRTGAVVATEGDYDLDELGDVDVTSAVETQILRHDGTSFVNDYNDIFFLRVKAREAINKGEAVYIFDAHNSNVAGIKKARADSASTMPCIGIAYETLALGDEGLIVAFGKANGIAANFTEGETMYVSPTTAGALTNTKPTSNTHLIQNVGILMQAHASNAVVKVTGVGRTNDVPNQFSVTGSITASALVTSGGSVNDFVKGDGSLDSTPYLTTETDPVVGGINGIVKADGLGTISPAVPFVDYVQTETDPIATPLAIANTNSINDINTKSHMWLTKAASQPYTPAATPAVIQYDTPQYDTGGDFDPINYAFVAPRDGFYLVDVGFYLAATPTWSFSMVYKSTNGGATWSYVMRNVSGSGQQNKLVNVLHLNAGDMIAHYANSSNTGTINVSVTSLTYFRVAEMIG